MGQLCRTGAPGRRSRDICLELSFGPEALSGESPAKAPGTPHRVSVQAFHTVPRGPSCPAQLPAQLLAVCRRRGPCGQPPHRPPVTSRAGGRSSPDTHPSLPPVSSAPPTAQHARTPAPLFTSRKPSLITWFRMAALPELPPHLYLAPLSFPSSVYDTAQSNVLTHSAQCSSAVPCTDVASTETRASMQFVDAPHAPRRPAHSRCRVK